MRNQLNTRQELFVDHFLACLNASEAARRAGYRRKPNVAGSELLKNSLIKSRISEELKTLTVSPEEAVARISALAKGSMEYFVSLDDKGRVRIDLEKARLQNKLYLIKRLKITKEEITIELHDTIKAMELVIKYSEIFKNYSGDRHTPESPFEAMRRVSEEGKYKINQKNIRRGTNYALPQ